MGGNDQQDSTTTSSTDWSGPGADRIDAVQTQAEEYFNSGDWGKVAEFNETQTGAFDMGRDAAGRMEGMEVSALDQMEARDISGMRDAELLNAQKGLAGDNSFFANSGNLGSGRQVINDQKAKRELSATFTGLETDELNRQDQALYDAYNIQGGAARGQAEIGFAEQQQAQKEMDAKALGFQSYADFLAATTAKETTQTTTYD